MRKYTPPGNLTKQQQFTLELVGIQEHEKTTRWVGAGCLITIGTVAIAVCVTIVMVKWMDDPPWLRAFIIVFGPNGLGWFCVIRGMYKQRERMESIQRSFDQAFHFPPLNGKN